MTLQEALKILGIEDYADRIFNSHSRGELSHLDQYFLLADTMKEDAAWFREWFEKVVKFAEEHWQRPESVFQHIYKFLP